MFKAYPQYALIALAIFLLSSCASGPPRPNASEIVTDTNFVIRDEVGVRPEVKEDFEKAIKYLQEEDYERGIRLLNRIVERAEKSIAPYINLGIAYRKTGEMKKAEESLTKALELNGVHPSANNEMAMVYRKTGRFSEARRIYESILERFPSFLPARKNLGILCDLYINDLDCALANYEIYNKADPGDKTVALWIVDLRQRIEK